MKYFLIVGEASGDLHASNLMRSLRKCDQNADFLYFGGDKMKSVGGTLLKHYKDIAYMGFIPVLRHAFTILKAMKYCRESIMKWQPDVVILVDYPGFNLKIAKYIKRHSNIPVYYYISPKIWAWKEYRIKDIKQNVDQMFSILPFEVDFYSLKHDYSINYVGNPSVDEIADWQSRYTDSRPQCLAKHNLKDLPIIALLPGSRKQEVADNLKIMLKAADAYVNEGFQLVIAAGPDIADDAYRRIINANVADSGHSIFVVRNATFEILSYAEAALVTSGTATLETALFRVPQIVCYYISCGKLFAFLRKHFLKVSYISLVNLIVNRELVPELVADGMNVQNLSEALSSILEDEEVRSAQRKGYDQMAMLLGKPGAPERAAEIMVKLLKTP